MQDIIKYKRKSNSICAMNEVLMNVSFSQFTKRCAMSNEFYLVVGFNFLLKYDCIALFELSDN